MRIAIVGCGQLARMMALAGWPMDFKFSFLADPGENSQCVQGLGEVVERTPDLTGEALFKALGEPSVVTVEREHVDVALLKTLQPFCKVYPEPDAIAICQHRGREKAFLNALGIPTAPFRRADCAASLAQAVAELGFPVFVKTCEQGYDGQGQWVIRDQEQLDALLAKADELPEVVVEGRVEFSREVSLIAARNPQGQCALYPVTENDHLNGILLSSIAPADDLPEALQAQAQQIAETLLQQWGYVGVLAIELFVAGDKLLVNELAPRVHNSGHWTQTAGVCSQFENHLRAITGQGLGETVPVQYAGMVNLLGRLAPEEITGRSNVQLHLYNKALRPGRKVGHLNLSVSSRALLGEQIREIRQRLYDGTENGQQ